VQRGAARVRAGGDAGGGHRDGRGPADQDRPGDARRHAAAAAGARHSQLDLLLRLRVSPLRFFFLSHAACLLVLLQFSCTYVRPRRSSCRTYNSSINWRSQLIFFFSSI
jgi:hypothetical protein